MQKKIWTKQQNYGKRKSIDIFPKADNENCELSAFMLLI